MRIILAYDYLSEIGGVERVMAAHARWLMEAGHTVRLVFSHVQAETTAYAFLQGLDIQEIGWRPKWPEAAKLMAAMAGWHRLPPRSADLIIAYSFPSLYVTRRAAPRSLFYYLPMEFVYLPWRTRWLWADDAKRKAAFFASLPLAPLLRRMDRRLIRKTTVLANSRFTQREILVRYGRESFLSYPPIHNVFCSGPSDPPLVRRYAAGAPLILTSGRIVPDKKTEWILEAMARMSIPAHLWVVGDIRPEYRAALEQTTKHLGLKDRVHWAGRIPQAELVELYRMADVFAFASPKEAFGLVPVEAMACGCPVVAWDDGAGPSEYVVSGRNGWLCRPYDIGAFAERIEACIRESFRAGHPQEIASSVASFTEASVRKTLLDQVAAATAGETLP